MSFAFPQTGPEKNHQIARHAFIQMELPQPVNEALDRETVDSGPSPASSFLIDTNQILPPSGHRALQCKGFLPVGAGDKQVTMTC